jgi:DNA-binding transcriptional MerR regulator
METKNVSRFLGLGITAIFEAYEAVSERQIKSNEIGISSRNLNYYKNQGLFFSDTLFEMHDHIIFNFTEYVWFQMILELRKFDIGLGVIKEIKELVETALPFDEFMGEVGRSEQFISKLPDDLRGEFIDIMHSDIDWKEVEKQVPVNLLSLMIAETIVKRKQVALMVNLQGDIFPFSLEDFNELSKDEAFVQFFEKTYVSISITEIIKRFITNFDLKVSSKKLMLLTEREAQMIRYLHEKKLESLTVHLDEKNSIRLIETKESYETLDKESRLLDLILKKGYQTIELKTQDGKIVYCKNIKKTRITD